MCPENRKARLSPKPFAVLTLVLFLMPGVAQAVDESRGYDRLGNELRGAFGTTGRSLEAPPVRVQDQRVLRVTPSQDTTTPAFRARAKALTAGPEATPATDAVPAVKKASYVIQLKPETNSDAARQLTQKYGLKVLPDDGLSKIGVIVVEVAGPSPGTDQPKSMAASLDDKLLADLKAEPIVREVTPNTVLTPNVLPPSTQGKGADRSGKTYFWDWRIGSGTPGDAKTDGNWGMKYCRFPTAWTIVDRRRHAEPSSPKITVGVLDVGFAKHEDLAFDILNITANTPQNHGNHVSGIIGGVFGNNLGISGGAPNANILALTTQELVVFEGPDNEERWGAAFSETLGSLIRLISEHPEIRVVNLSLGYNWVPNFGVDPANSEKLRNRVREQGVIVRAVADFVAKNGTLIVSAAGNDSDATGALNVKALWASPFNWAALSQEERGPAPNMLVVEAIDRFGKRANFSNVGGHVSAPGVEILSAGAGGPADYMVMNGTSMAAPLVSALAALMFEYDPSLAPETVAQIIKATTHISKDTAAPHIDALEALLGMNPKASRWLADLNSDGKVNATDLEKFSTEMQLVQPGASGFTADLNGDGAIDANESAWPRIDLNGSGRASTDDTDRQLIGGRMMSDLEVLEAAWDENAAPANPSAAAVPSAASPSVTSEAPETP